LRSFLDAQQRVSLRIGEVPMTFDKAFDRNSAEALVKEITSTFIEGLEGLVAAAASKVDVESRRLSVEATDLAELRVHLEQERCALNNEKVGFEQERALFEPGGREHSEMVSLNLGGEATLTVLHSTLTQCEGSMLSAAFSGRWELPKDENGHVFIDFEPGLFIPLVQHMRMRRIEDPADPIAAPCLDGPELQTRFLRMLRYYGLEEWVYRDCIPEPVEHQMRILDRVYAVVPPVNPDETIAFGDMSCQTVLVPRGWEVLNSDVDDFEEIIRELANHSWGALRLCCQNPTGNFSSYLTRLHGGGTAGTRWSGDARMLQASGSLEGRPVAYRFSSACSARLVIRMKDKPPGWIISDEGRRLTAI